MVSMCPNPVNHDCPAFVVFEVLLETNLRRYVYSGGVEFREVVYDTTRDSDNNILTGFTYDAL